MTIWINRNEFLTIFESSSLNLGQFLTYESLSDQKLENFESKDFETLSSNQFSKINITRECSIWKHSRHLQIPVILGQMSEGIRSSAKSLVISLSLRANGHVKIVYFKLAYFALESTWKYFFLNQFGTGGISWNLLNQIFFKHVDYNLTFARVTHGNLMPQSLLDEPWRSLNIFLKIRSQLILMEIISQLRLN